MKTTKFVGLLIFFTFAGLLFPKTALQANGIKQPEISSERDIPVYQSRDLSGAWPLAEDILQRKKKAKKNKKEYKGQATYYNDKYHGRKTASGEIYDKDKLTAAVRRDAVPLEYGTVIEVTIVSTGKKVKVKVNDRMSDKASAIIDLSRAAAEKVGLITAGRMDVTISVVKEAGD